MTTRASSRSRRAVFSNCLRTRRVEALPRQHRKKSVPARRTSVHGRMQQSPEELEASFSMLSGNSLQLKSSAAPAMRVDKISKRHLPRKKPVTALATAPRSNFCDTVNIIRRASPPRALAIVALALRTNQITTSAGIRAPKNRLAIATAQDLSMSLQERL